MSPTPCDFQDGLVKKITSEKIKMVLFLAFVATLALTLGACSSSESGSSVPEQTMEITDPGQTVFLNQCVSCHMGAGNPRGPNDIIMRSAKLASEKAFIHYVRQPDNAMMPAFSEAQVSDDELNALYAYLKKLSR
ncbi:MAG: cytochrome c [Vampirovibrionales bacterium]|nr:cytochrome c [Vampirovibrionales bacterium]